jgi:DNA invertase Pin-like site-specific DNA recombinase
MSYIAYYRVSTAKQSLGLEAQRAQVTQFLGQAPAQEFIERESGKNNERPQLRAALEAAEKLGGKLVVAKLDRLSRTASFLHSLQDKRVDFACADLPELNTLTLGIFASLAQHERELISARTSAALQSKKAKGAKLGSPKNLTYEAQVKGAQARKAQAAQNENNRKAQGYICTLRDSEGLSFNKIAQRLNSEGFETAQGKQFKHQTVKNLYDRAKNTP